MGDHRRAGPRALAVTVLCLASAIRPAAQRALPEVSIGIVRADAVLQPLAELHDGAWQALVVEDPNRNALSVTSRGRTLASRGWRLFPAGGSFRPLTTMGLTETASHCSDIEGFQTDAPKGQPRANEWPQPKIGLAVLGPVTVERPENVVAQPDADSRRAARVVVGVVQTLEADAMAVDARASAHGLTPVVRAKRVVQLASFFRVRAVGAAQYYFEARKRYTDAGLDTFVSGWIKQGGVGPVLSHVHVTITDMDYKGVPRARVLGVLALANRHVWVLQDVHYEGESYTLIDWADDRPGPVLTVPGGGC